MRELRFRAWDKKNKRIVDETLLMSRTDLSNALNRKRVYSDWVIMQYTGIKDKNGTPIFEGDILRWGQWDQEETEVPDVYIISYEAPSFIWRCYRDEKELDAGGELRDTEDFEVVGNIYENPELLA